MAVHPEYRTLGNFTGTAETNPQREAVAKLCTYAEGMISRGQLPELDELNLRVFVNETCAAFQMAPIREKVS